MLWSLMSWSGRERRSGLGPSRPQTVFNAPLSCYLGSASSASPPATPSARRSSSRPRGRFTPIDDMVGGGPFGLKPASGPTTPPWRSAWPRAWSSAGGFDPARPDAALRALVAGGLPEQHRPAASTSATRPARPSRRFETGAEPVSAAPTDPHAAGNGSLMRLAPVPLFFARRPRGRDRAVRRQLPHHPRRAGCGRRLPLPRGPDRGGPQGGKAELCAGLLPRPGHWVKAHFPEDRRGRRRLVQAKEPPAIQGTGYVVDSLEAALWAFYRTDYFRDGALLAVNLDADTTGAVYGQLAGAYYG